MTTPDPILSALVDVLNAARKVVGSVKNLLDLDVAIQKFDRIAIDEGLKKWVENQNEPIGSVNVGGWVWKLVRKDVGCINPTCSQHCTAVDCEAHKLI